MHTPKTFAQTDTKQLRALITQYPFGTLMTHSDAGLEASHIPFVLAQSQGKDYLHGHIARANPLWKTLPDSCDVLVVFHGPHHYISPNYYPTKHDTGKGVPTWNYVVAHVKGTMSFIHDPQWNLTMLDRLTQHNEASQPNPWTLSDSPDGYIQKMLPAIVGLNINITSITGQWKLSQNQPEHNRQGVIAGLSDLDTCEANTMAECVKNAGIISDV